MFYDGYQTDKDDYGYTPLMEWIIEHKDEDIPKEMYYDGC